MLSVAGAWHTLVVMQELRVKIMREEERWERGRASTAGGDGDEAEAWEWERLKAVELESLLKKHKHQVEKQQKWVES
jgi:hypothetical protein